MPVTHHRKTCKRMQMLAAVSDAAQARGCMRTMGAAHPWPPAEDEQHRLRAQQVSSGTAQKAPGTLNEGSPRILEPQQASGALYCSTHDRGAKEVMVEGGALYGFSRRSHAANATCNRSLDEGGRPQTDRSAPSF